MIDNRSTGGEFVNIIVKKCIYHIWSAQMVKHCGVMAGRLAGEFACESSVNKLGLIKNTVLSHLQGHFR